jgi:Domain of unknown function (DUF4412)
MKKLFLILTLIVFACAFLSADVYVKTKSHTGAIMGQPAKDQITEQWIGADKFANISEDQATVMDLGKKKVFMIYHKTKSYVEADLPLDIKALVPAEAAAMMNMMKATVSVTATDETKKIGEWNCKKYTMDMDMQMFKMKSISWVTTDVPFDWKNYSERLFTTLMSSSMPFLDDKSLEEFKKFKGFQIASEMTMNLMGSDVKVTSNVLEITKKDAPAGTYSVPEGYKKQDKITMKSGM